MEVLEKPGLKELVKFRHATCYQVNGHPHVMIIKATSNYIPKTQFQEMFISLGKIIAQNKITRLIFDLTALSYFHEPTFDWYFLVWKEHMLYMGLKSHRIILPNNKEIKEAIEVCRQKALDRFPEETTDLDIQYAASIEDSLVGY